MPDNIITADDTAQALLSGGIYFKRDGNEHALGMQLSLMTQADQLYSLWLQGTPEGKYRFEETETENLDFVYIEAENGRWYAFCVGQAAFLLENNKAHKVLLKDQQQLPIVYEGKRYVMYVETVSSNSNIYHNYFVEQNVGITIGRSESNDICYTSPFVSSNHALLRYNEGSWSVRDISNKNGVYLNGRRVTEASLNVGDKLFVMGLRAIIGVGFVSLNDGNNRIYINDEKLRYITKNQLRAEEMTEEEEDEVYFNRMPRKRLPLNAEPISLEFPPMSLDSNKIPLLLRMGGPLVMSTNAMLAGRFTMLFSSVLFPFLTQKYTDREKKQYEERRKTKYREYLALKEQEIRKECAQEQDVLNQNYPPLDTILSYTTRRDRLWERRSTDDDFLSLRVGYGTTPMLAPLDYPAKGFSLDEDELETEMYNVAENEYNLERVPIMASITEEFVCGVLGPRNLTFSFIRRLIYRISILNSPEEVKLVFLMKPEDLAKLEFIKYLPHVWNNQRNIRFIATNTSEAYQISEYLKNEFGEDITTPGELKKVLRIRPYYVVIAFSKPIFDSVGVLSEIMAEEENHGVSILTVFDDLPKECSKIFSLDSSGCHAVQYLKKLDRQMEHFYFDTYHRRTADISMKTISNLKLRLEDQGYTLPKTVTFLEMYGVGKVEHLNPLKRWKDNNPVKSLAAPIGVGTDGQLFCLDLHEKYQGPHGLVAGMTGSGKSEFIITYILSMAVNFNPDEVAFILIDYKGGGLAGAFEDPDRGIHLPHLVGTITNLDGAAIQRSLMSIQSELKRRQSIFNKAKSIANEGTMDIYTYQKLFRSGVVTEALPHLFIISDEFAELKQQEPEFMDQLISAARIGRSLGVHLILATQKPAGVVNEQIRSNTKFRVCLRVQDKSDSNDMLKRPEAAELTDTGRFYLQVGYNELFALGQSAWCGADYEPQDEVVIHKDDAVSFINDVGQSIYEVKPKVQRKKSGIKQIVAIVKYLSDLAQREQIAPRKLWTEALGKEISIQSMLENNDVSQDRISALVGVVDDPETQKQFPLYLELQEWQNLLIFGDGASGKSTLLQTMLYSLVKSYTPEQVNFYVFDFSCHTFNVFKAVPHCGGVVTEEDADAVERMFRLIAEIAEERKRLFATAEVNSFEAYCEVNRIPLIVVVIDNYVGLSGMKKGVDDYIYTLHEKIRAASGYGIRFVITVGFLNEINSKTRQQCGGRLTLHMKDRFDYSEALNCRTKYTPPEGAGRGMCCVEERAMEYQTAMYVAGETEQERIQMLRRELDGLAQAYEGALQAKKLLTIVENETYEEFCMKQRSGVIPLGYDLEKYAVVNLPLKQFSCMSVYFGNPLATVPVLKNFLYAAKREKMSLMIVRGSKNSLFDQDSVLLDEAEWTSVTYFASTVEGSEQLWRALSAKLVARKKQREEYCEEQSWNPKAKDTPEKCFSYLRKYSKPVLLLFENFRDFINNPDEAATTIYPTIFKMLAYSNIYAIACFGPGEGKQVKSSLSAQQFIGESLVLSFGGQLNQQDLVTLPTELRNQTAMVEKYNKCVMRYRGKFHLFQMPCEIVENTALAEDEDDASIF